MDKNFNILISGDDELRRAYLNRLPIREGCSIIVAISESDPKVCREVTENETKCLNCEQICQCTSFSACGKCTECKACESLTICSKCHFCKVCGRKPDEIELVKFNIEEERDTTDVNDLTFDCIIVLYDPSGEESHDFAVASVFNLRETFTKDIFLVKASKKPVPAKSVSISPLKPFETIIQHKVGGAFLICD